LSGQAVCIKTEKVVLGLSRVGSLGRNKMKKSLVLSLSIWLAFSVVLHPFLAQTDETTGDYNNVLIVLDASGSMDGTLKGTSIKKMDAAKDALRQVLQQVPADTQIGLLVFSGRNIKSDLLYPLGPRDDERLMQAISLPQPGGGTPLGAYIKTGADLLLRQRAKQRGYGTYRLLIVTDGEAGDKPLVQQYVPEVIARGITMDVIGVDMETTHTLATKAHSYRTANDPESLMRAVSEVFAEVSQAGADDTASEEAFALLDPIPAEMADAMIKALSSSGNEPIGQPRAAVAEQETIPQGHRQASPPPVPKRIRTSEGIRTVFIVVAAIALIMAKFRKRR